MAGHQRIESPSDRREMVIMRSSCGHHVVTMWSSGGHHAIIRWSSGGHQVVMSFSDVVPSHTHAAHPPQASVPRCAPPPRLRRHVPPRSIRLRRVPSTCHRVRRMARGQRLAPRGTAGAADGRNDSSCRAMRRRAGPEHCSKPRRDLPDRAGAVTLCTARRRASIDIICCLY